MLTLKTLRVSHLLLALAAAAAYFSGEAGGGIHKLIGYTVAALLIARLLLSLFGGGVFGWRRWVPPVTAPAALRGMKHPAISRLLVLAILTCTAGAATTGVLMDQGRALANPSFTWGDGEENEEGEGGEGDEDGEEEAGLRSLRTLSPTGIGQHSIATAGLSMVRSGEGGEEESEEDEGPLSELHELFANMLLPLVGLHVAYLLLFRFSLARFMLFWPSRKSPA